MNNEQQTIDLNTLSIDQLNQLQQNIVLQIGGYEIEKQRVFGILATVNEFISRKQQEAAQVQPVAVPKLKKLNLPSLKKQQDQSEAEVLADSKPG